MRKSIVPNSRSIAGGPQIRAPIARYARNNLDEAPAVAEAGSSSFANTVNRRASPPTAATRNCECGYVRNSRGTRYGCSFSYAAIPSVGSCELIELHPMSMRALRSTA